MKKALTDKQLAQQLERLKKVPWAEKAEALDHLLLVISRLLHGYLVVDENGRKHLAGGNTRFGAHSEREVGGETLYDYQTKVVEKLYDGSCRWMPQNTLAEQLEKIANSMIPKMVPVYKNQVKKEEEVGYCRKTVSLDVEWMGKEDDYTGDETDELKLVGNYKEYEEKLPEGQTSEIPTEGGNTGGNGGNTGGNSGSSTGSDTTGTPVLTISKSGSGSATVSAGGSDLNSGAEVAANTEVTVTITPAAGKVPTATIGGNTVTLTESDGTYTGTFQMPSANATLVINTGSGGDNGDTN